MIDPLPAKSGPLGGVLMRGAAWMVGMRWAVRGLAIISTIVLARLLAPADFGLVALAMTIIALGSVLTDFGVHNALIQNARAERRHFDTAWTIQIIQGCGVAVLVFLLADHAATFYDDPRVAEILVLLALGIVIRGFENIGIVNFRKNLLFNKEFTYFVSIKIMMVALTIGLAFWFQDFRALVYAQLAGQFIKVGISYYASAYRPRLSLAAMGEIWTYSQWILARGFAAYIVSNVDTLMLGRFGSPAMVGMYRIGREVSDVPGNEVVGPISRALFPGYAKLQHEPVRLAAAVCRTVAAVTLVTAPMAFGLSAVAPELVPILLGEKWLEAVPVAQMMAMAALLGGMKSAAGNALAAIGYVRLTALVWWTQAIFLAALVYPGFVLAGLAGLAAARIIMECAGVLVTWRFLVGATQIGMAELLNAVWAPIAAGAIMYFALYVFEGFVEGDLLQILAIKVMLGLVIYPAVLLIIWRLRACPKGAEELFISAMLQRLRRLIPQDTR